MKSPSRNDEIMGDGRLEVVFDGKEGVGGPEAGGARAEVLVEGLRGKRRGRAKQGGGEGEKRREGGEGGEQEEKGEGEGQ